MVVVVFIVCSRLNLMAAYSFCETWKVTRMLLSGQGVVVRPRLTLVIGDRKLEKLVGLKIVMCLRMALLCDSGLVARILRRKRFRVQKLWTASHLGNLTGKWPVKFPTWVKGGGLLVVPPGSGGLGGIRGFEWHCSAVWNGTVPRFGAGWWFRGTLQLRLALICG